MYKCSKKGLENSIHDRVCNLIPLVGRFYEAVDASVFAVESDSFDVAVAGLVLTDDLVALRTGLHQRWQTKRGMPGKRRIIDWITFDTNASFFPRPARDDFGEPR